MNRLELTKRNNEMLKLRIEGHPMSEIAEMYGISRQRVFQLTNKLISKDELFRARQEQLDIEKIRYQGIYEMFKKDYRMTYYKFQCIASKSKYRKATLMERWRRFLQGETKDVTIELSWINNLIEYSGMTYEELFKERNLNENTKGE